MAGESPSQGGAARARARVLEEAAREEAARASPGRLVLDDAVGMRAVCQRVSQAQVTVGGTTVGQIGRGLVVLLGIARDDSATEAERLAGKVARLRIFEDGDGKFARSLLDVSGAALVVSQFTLVADTAKGNRPSFAGAARPELAEPLYQEFCRALVREGVEVQKGRFGARMEVALVNDGPVTIVIDLDPR